MPQISHHRPKNISVSVRARSGAAKFVIQDIEPLYRLLFVTENFYGLLAFYKLFNISVQFSNIFLLLAERLR